MTAYTEPSFVNPEIAQFVDAIIKREHELLDEGIDEREVHRVVVAEFSSGQNYVDPPLGTVNNNPTEPALTDGQATTTYPPLVIPAVEMPGPFDNDGFDHKNPDPGYAGGRDVVDLDQYHTNAPENKIVKSAYMTDPMGDAIASQPDSQPPTLGTKGYVSDMAIPPWRYNLEDSQGGDKITLGGVNEYVGGRDITLGGMRESYDESKHPRDEDGKWASTSSGIADSNNEFEKKIGKATDGLPENLEERIMNPFSRTTDPNSSYGYSDIQNAWDEAITQKPELAKTKQELIKYGEQVNKSIQELYDKSDTLYRGIRTEELEAMAKTGVAEPWNYNFMSYINYILYTS